MNVAKLKHALAVDRLGSISAAARSLNLTQSTVSRSLADLEAEIGYALFDRRARDVVVTERGRTFLNRAARIVSDFDQLQADARRSREAGETLVRIGVSPASMQGLVNQAIVALLGRRPDLRLHVEAMSVAGGLRALRRGDVDILVGPEDDMKTGDFDFQKLGELKTHLFSRKAHPLAGANAVNAEDVAAYPVIAPDRMSWHADRLRTLFASDAGDAARRMHMIEYFPLVADIVASSEAIGIIGEEYAASATFTKRFSLLAIDFFEPLSVGYATRPRWRATPALRAFQNVLQEFPPGA